MFVIELALIGAALALLPLSWILWRVRSDRYRKLAWLTMFLTLDLVMFGGFTRLTDSGLGCPDWPGCYASSSPFAAHASIAAAYAAMPSGPVSVMKAWIEMIHRYFAMAIGLLIVLMTAIAWMRRWRGQPLPASPWWPTALLAWVLVQGAFGAWTVTLKLQPVIVTTHLLLGLGLLAALGLFAARMTPAPRREPATGRSFAAALVALALLLVQIALGGWVSTNYAVLACTDFPTCNGQWMPSMDFAQGFHLWRSLGLNAHGEMITQDALVAIHWTHRTFAMIVIAYLLGWAWCIRRVKALTRLADGVLAVVVLQFLTGLSNIVLQWPLPVAVAHNGGAAILLLLVVMLNWHIASSRAVAASSAESSAVTA